MKFIQRCFVVSALLLAPLASLRANDQVYTKVDQNPVPLKTPPPLYPSHLRDQGVDGVVVIAAVISELGLVTDCEVSKTTNEAFVTPAINAVKGWKFKPGVKDGSPVKVKLMIPVRFSTEE